jgi:medium-chain acyl-[acyl-carrier-protein] hydrolase
MTNTDDTALSAEHAAAGLPFSREYFLHYYDCDARRRQTVFSMLRYFEDMAMIQSEQCGIGLDFYASHNVAWMLTQYDIVIHQRPTLGSTALVHTRPLAFRNMLATRSFAIDREDGTRCVDALSHWVYIDTVRRRPRRIDEAMFTGYGISAESPELAMPPALPPPALAMEEREFSVRMSDIDHNGHVNNLRYVEWALEALPEDLRQHGNMTKLSVQFRRETRYGGSVFARSAWERRDGHIVAEHAIASNSVDVCLLRSEWRE